MFSPLRHGCVRTIKFSAPGEYLMVMDLDGYGLDEHMLRVGKRVWEQSPEEEKPLLKDSGKKGLQLIWKVIFPQPIEEPKAVRMLELLSWEYYNKYNLKDFNIDFGPPGIAEKPHVDTSMFQVNRKVRGFCTRFDGNYSVPLHPRDDLATAELRRKLVRELSDYTMGTIIFSERLLTCDQPPHYVDEEADRLRALSVDIGRVPLSHQDTFNRLPSYFRGVVVYEGDIHHWRKRMLVWYLFRMGYAPEYVVDFVWETCKWSDLNDQKITREQVHSLHRTFMNIIAESGAMTFPEYVFDTK